MAEPGEKPGLTAEAALGLMVPTFDQAAASVGADCSRVTCCSRAVSVVWCCAIRVCHNTPPKQSVKQTPIIPLHVPQVKAVHVKVWNRTWKYVRTSSAMGTSHSVA